MTDNKTLVGLYLGLQRALARSIARIAPPDEVEDIVQETYVRVCQIKQPERITQPRSFLLKTARNLALDAIKRADRRLNQPLEPAHLDGGASALVDATGDPMARTASDEEFARFCEAVRQLPQQCRRVFVLRKVYGYSQREIAEQLKLSQSTVEKHIASGMKRCTHLLASPPQTTGGKEIHHER